MVNFLIIGASSLFKQKIYPALKQSDLCTKIFVASLTNLNEIDASLPKISLLFDNYSDAISHPLVDWVYVSNRNSDHFQAAKLALLNKKHVIIDKPAVLSVAEAEQLIKLSNISNCYLCEATVFTYHLQFGYINAFHKKHSVRNIITQFSFPNFDLNNFRLSSKSGGGVTYDLGAYIFGLGRELFKHEPIDIKCHVQKDENGLDTFVTAYLKYNENKTLIGLFGFGTPYSNKASFISENATLNLNRVFTTTTDLRNTIHIQYANKKKDIIMETDDPFKKFLETCILFKKRRQYFHKSLLENAVLIKKLRAFL